MKKKIGLFALTIISTLWLSAGFVTSASTNDSCDHQWVSRGGSEHTGSYTHDYKGEKCYVTCWVEKSYRFCTICQETKVQSTIFHENHTNCNGSF